ncbi:hypothetical protein GGH96_004355 [Coemansia sp. RSA 1972]|nr:hypothetical protein GGH96_004355 [Coemansia sp. RSA 1972]
MPAAVATRYAHIGSSNTNDMSTTSIKSLASHLKTLHQKASRALILGQNSAAWEHSRAAVEYCNIERLTHEYGEQQARQLCCRLWILYICVVSSVTEVAETDGSLRIKQGVDVQGVPESVRSVWTSVVKAFGGCAGDVDSEVLVPTVLLSLKLRDARTARDIVESWLATLSDEYMCLLGAQSVGAQQTMASYVRVCELYMLHVLPQLGDLNSAYEFLSASTVVSDSVKREFTKRLDALRNPPVLTRKRKAVKSKKPRKPKLVQSPVQIVAKTEAVVETQPKPATSTHSDLPSLAALVPRSAKVGVRRQTKAGAVVRRPRSTLSVAWRVVRRLMSRWGFTLFTLAVAVAVIRMLTQRFRVPHFFTAVYRKLWNTVKMGTQVTYI